MARLAVHIIVLSAAIIAVAAYGAPSDRHESRERLSIAGHILDWKSSTHIKAGVTCESCHGDAAHGSKTESMRWSANRVIETCGRCHRDIELVFRSSGHFKDTTQQERYPSCTTCHRTTGGHILPFDQLSANCAGCHDPPKFWFSKTIGERATALIEEMRELTVASALLNDRVQQHGRHGENVDAHRATLARLEGSFVNLAVEWHRFDLDAVTERVRRATSQLEQLHLDLPGWE